MRTDPVKSDETSEGRLILLALSVGSFAIGTSEFASAIPTIQVRLTRLAPGAPTLMGAMNMAALNLSNAIGAWAGGAAIAGGLGLLSPAWAGVALTVTGLLLFAIFSSSDSKEKRLSHTAIARSVAVDARY
ncbi:hypothetical protein AB9E05_06065 [Rhizobium leguminosarum]